MMSRLALAAVFCLMVGNAGAEPVTTIRNNGSSANRLDIAVLGDGYTAAEIASGKYALDVEAAVNGLFAQDPFREYRAYFNVHRVDVTSAESGADHPSVGILRNTALDATYDCAGITRLICVNVTKVNAVLTSSIASPAARDMTLVLVNDPQYGGSGGTVSVSSTNSAAVEIVLHELGHSLGSLADEYGGPPPPNCVNNVEPVAPNATSRTVRTDIKWNAWISPATPIPTTGTANGIPGLYQGAQYCDVGLFRPTFNSKMRSLSVPFYQINTEQLIKRFHNYVSPIDDATPSGSSVIVPSGASRLFTVTTPHPLSHSLGIVWRLDGNPVGSGAQYVVNASAGSGIHTLLLVVSDPTTLVKNDPAGLLRATRTWTVVVAGGGRGDFDGDGKSDITVFRPATGQWFVRQSSTLTLVTLVWGGGADKPVPGDYDGDGIDDIAVFRPSTGEWFVRQSSTLTLVTLVWGGSTDIPVQGDYDGDGTTDIAIFRPATGEWFVRQSSTLTLITLVWGGGTDIPVHGDYDGDGKTDIAVFRPATGEWFVRQSSTLTLVTLIWGGGADIPVPGDYDGDGKMDIAVFRPSTGEWFIRQSSTLTLLTIVWGGSSDLPINKRP